MSRNRQIVTVEVNLKQYPGTSLDGPISVTWMHEVKPFVGHHAPTDAEVARALGRALDRDEETILRQLETDHDLNDGRAAWVWHKPETELLSIDSIRLS